MYMKRLIRYAGLWITLMHSVISLTVAQPYRADIESIIEKEYTQLLGLYKYLHQHPELSLEEKCTAGLLASRLKDLGFAVTENVGGHGVVGVMKNGDGPVVMIRTDMDALPIKEETGLPYASEGPAMHACGHDMHMAVWTGTATVISQLKQHWRGTVLFVAQPAEEIGAGAKAMMDDGLFSRFLRPDYALALHVSSVLTAGQVGVRPGDFLASIDNLEILVKGRGGHGAVPQHAIDPIVLASKIILSLQTIVSREISPLDPAVVSVGSIHGGIRGNIIPDEVKLELTVRTFGDDTRTRLLAAIKRVCDGTAAAAGLEPERYPVISPQGEHLPFLRNDPILTERMAAVFRQTIGDENVIALSREMVGEDFSRYGRGSSPVPIMMYSLGTVPADRAAAAASGGTRLPPLHSPNYFPETTQSIPTGIKTMSSAVISLLSK